VGHIYCFFVRHNALNSSFIFFRLRIALMFSFSGFYKFNLEGVIVRYRIFLFHWLYECLMLQFSTAQLWLVKM
jgi:hypothetical protein